jgi:hypothetical protein
MQQRGAAHRQLLQCRAHAGISTKTPTSVTLLMGHILYLQKHGALFSEFSQMLLSIFFGLLLCFIYHEEQTIW